jgi:hypothetical protein
MKTPLLLLGLALACALWAPAAEASTIFHIPSDLVVKFQPVDIVDGI